MIGLMILKIMTTLVLTILAIAGAYNAPKQKTTSDGVLSFALAMFLAFGITFMWVYGIAYVVTGDYANYPISHC